jgi:hypothetical protein
MVFALACLRCSRGCVREVFKVMAQVDHYLTTVNCVDQQLRLIKNLGRHRGLTTAPRVHDRPDP